VSKAGNALQSIAFLVGGPATYAALTEGWYGTAIAVAGTSLYVFKLGLDADREVEAAARTASPPPPGEKPSNLIAFELACAIDGAWSDEGPDLFALPDVYVTTRDLRTFAVGARQRVGFAVPLASLLDRTRFDAWLANVDDGRDADWPTLLLDDEAGWNPAEALAARAIAALKAQAKALPQSPVGSPEVG